MSKRSILVSTQNQKAIEYVTTYFQDTASIPTIIRSKYDLSSLSACTPDVFFLEAEWLQKRAIKEIEDMRKRHPQVKLIALGYGGDADFKWDGRIGFPIEDKSYRNALFDVFTFPNPIKLLVVDDEPDVVEVVQDYFQARKPPLFEVRTAQNGLEGFQLVKKEAPDCMILDIKMPVRTGVELYRDVGRAGHRIPTIMFIDATASDNLREIRRWGSPVFVEKGGSQSSMPEMLALVKKLVLFA
jgi:CheY-like chemotaxis protein